MLKTFEELTKNEEWLKAIKNLKRRDTDKEFDEKCKNFAQIFIPKFVYFVYCIFL